MAWKKYGKLELGYCPEIELELGFCPEIELERCNSPLKITGFCLQG